MFKYLINKAIAYPRAPFSPDRAYPELAGICNDVDPNNLVYPQIRELFRLLDSHDTQFNNPQWNPLGRVVGNHRSIVVKPNLVLHKVGESPASIHSLVVHASVLRVLIDYLLLAVSRRGFPAEITIADTPLQGADFELLCQQNGLTQLMEHYKARHASVRLIDLRTEQAVINQNFRIIGRKKLSGDPKGSLIVDLGGMSEHWSASNSGNGYAVQDYDDAVTVQNHTNTVHRYSFSQSILNADLIINVSKLKTHCKAGVTLSLKNIVGANTSKDYLPHFKKGSPEQGGDEFARSSLYQRAIRNTRDFFNRHHSEVLSPAHTLLKKVACAVEEQRANIGKEVAYGGAWHGNDTLWRTIVDINRILLFCDSGGTMQQHPQRQLHCLVDGIIGMEGDGPLKGTDFPAGVVAWGDDPVEFDAKLTYLMGFDPGSVKHIEHWRRVSHLSVGNFPSNLELELKSVPRFWFREPRGWRGVLRARSNEN